MVFAVQTQAMNGSWEDTSTPRWTATASEFNEWNTKGETVTACITQLQLFDHPKKRIDVSFDAPQISSDG